MYIILTLVLLIAIALIWRLASKRHVIPCPSYLAWMVEIDNPFAKENRSKSIISHLMLNKDVKIADIGCGPGRVTIPLLAKLKNNSSLDAIDIQMEMLDKINSKIKDSSKLNLVKGQLGNNILEHNKYDYILLVNVLGEIPNQHEALKEIYKALKPGGILSITETIFDPHYQRYLTLEKMAKKYGFEKENYFGKWYSYTVHFKALKN